MEQLSMFTTARREEKLSKLGNNLQKLEEKINWEFFRPILEEAINRAPRKKGGRKPYDEVLIFKILVLQRIYNLSDEQTSIRSTIGLAFCSF